MHGIHSASAERGYCHPKQDMAQHHPSLEKGSFKGGKNINLYRFPQDRRNQPLHLKFKHKSGPPSDQSIKKKKKRKRKKKTYCAPPVCLVSTLGSPIPLVGWEGSLFVARFHFGLGWKAAMNCEAGRLGIECPTQTHPSHPHQPSPPPSIQANPPPHCSITRPSRSLELWVGPSGSSTNVQ